MVGDGIDYFSQLFVVFCFFVLCICLQLFIICFVVVQIFVFEVFLYMFTVCSCYCFVLLCFPMFSRFSPCEKYIKQHISSFQGFWGYRRQDLEFSPSSSSQIPPPNSLRKIRKSSGSRVFSLQFLQNGSPNLPPNSLRKIRNQGLRGNVGLNISISEI